ncbi:unnamed protein product, partial [Protopolystoma xenopodis]
RARCHARGVADFAFLCSHTLVATVGCGGAPATGVANGAATSTIGSYSPSPATMPIGSMGAGQAVSSLLSPASGSGASGVTAPMDPGHSTQAGSGIAGSMGGSGVSGFLSISMDNIEPEMANLALWDVLMPPGRNCVMRK